MKKFIFRFLSFSILILVILVALVIFNIDSILKFTIESYASQALDTKVEINSVETRFKRNRIRLKNPTIANPAGFSSPNAFSASVISTEFDPSNSNEKQVVIDKFAIHSPVITLEINNDLKTNLAALENSAQSFISKSDTNVKPDTTDTDINVIINDFVMNNGRVILLIESQNNKQYEQAIPDIQLSNIGGDSGSNIKIVSAKIYQSILDAIQSALKKQGIDPAIRNKISSSKQQLKNETNRRIESEKSSLKDKLKNKFQ